MDGADRSIPRGKRVWNSPQMSRLEVIRRGAIGAAGIAAGSTATVPPRGAQAALLPLPTGDASITLTATPNPVAADARFDVELTGLALGHLVTLRGDPNAGHLVQPPYVPTAQDVDQFGGTQQGMAAADADSWPRVLAMLKTRLTR